MKSAKCVTKKARKSSRYRSIHRYVPTYNRSYNMPKMNHQPFSFMETLGLFRALRSKRANRTKADA